MTKLLEEAISRVTEAPEDCQDMIGSLILKELEDDRRWDEAFARNPEKLERMADEARAERAAGLTTPLDLSNF